MPIYKDRWVNLIFRRSLNEENKFRDVSIPFDSWLNGCSSSPKDALKNSVNEYKECTNNGDSKCIASYTDTSILKLSGGSDKFADNLQNNLDQMKSKMNISMKINNIGKIRKFNKTLQANITVTNITKILDEQMKKVMGEKTEEKESMIAISNDNGKTWYFTNKDSQEFVKDLKDSK